MKTGDNEIQKKVLNIKYKRQIWLNEKYESLKNCQTADSKVYKRKQEKTKIAKRKKVKQIFQFRNLEKRKNWFKSQKYQI